LPQLSKKNLSIKLLFNSLSELQTKPLPPIRHICDFSRGVLNVRSIRSHPTLAPRPQICLIGGNSFYAVAREGELNRGDLGTEADVFCLLENESVSLPAAIQNLNYNICARSSSALICDNIAGAISNTLLAPHSPFLESL
jgi:hypothetical protein